MRVSRHWVGKGAKALVLVLVLLGLTGLVVMALWNALVPDVFHGSRIDFWQAVGLLLLSRLLFGSWRWSGAGGHLHRRWHHHGMTLQERERLRERLAACGGAPPAPPPGS